MNDMSEYDACVFRTSSQTYENLSFCGIYGGIHTFSQLAVTSRPTRCVVSVPAEKLHCSTTQQNIMLITQVVTKILSIYTSPDIYTSRSKLPDKCNHN